MIAIVDPWQADAVMVAKAMPPLWQYFLRLQRGRRGPFRTPKGANHGPPRTFPCITVFSRDREEGP